MTDDPGIQRNIRCHILLGCGVLVSLVVGLGGWAATAELSGAVVSSGVLVVDLNVKKVQHPTGGIVGEINVRDGDKVKAGELVIRLDETVTRANLAIVVKGLDELDARQARLKAERDELPVIEFPQELRLRATNPQVGEILQEEQKLFDIRYRASITVAVLL